MKVWLIWQVSASDGHVCYVCGTEKQARKRFEDVKQEIIREDEEIYGVHDKYENKEDIKMQEEHLEKRKRILNAMTFDNLEPGHETVNAKPHWEVWRVE